MSSTKRTCFQQLDPRTKLVWLCGCLLVCATTGQIGLLVGLIAAVFALSCLAGLELRRYLPLTRAWALLGFGVLLLHLMFTASGDVLFSIGPVAFYSEGARLGATVALRLYAILLGLSLFAMCTEPTELSLVMVKAGLGYRYAMLGGLVLVFFPLMEEELQDIFSAQASRGLGLEGALRKALAFGPILVPFCLRSLRRSNEVALAMEMRAFGLSASRTFTREIRLQARDYGVMAGLASLLVAYFLVMPN